MSSLKTMMGFAAVTAMCWTTTGCIGADEDAPDFAGGGEDQPLSAEYPEGPYGFEVGSTLPNLEFLGYPNFSALGEELRITALGDFYNPTGAEVFGPELGYYGEGGLKPKALVMLISSVWCGPCQAEASGLPDEQNHYGPMGGRFLAVLIDGPEPGTPANVDDLRGWSTRFNPNYPMTMDPSNDVMAFYEPAFPGNIIIRTSDMKIIERVAGIPQQAFWNTFEQVLNGTYQEPLSGN